MTRLIMFWMKTLFVISGLTICNWSCKKLVTVDAPYTSTNADNVFATDATATAVLTGIYTQMSSASPLFVGIQGISYYGGLSADEFIQYSGETDVNQKACYQNLLTSNLAPADLWTSIYPYIFMANQAIEGLKGSSSLTVAVKQQLLGEAEFLRAFFYFYLVNFYGDVPLVLTTDYKTNSAVARTPVAQVYSQIISDLKSAQAILNSNYVGISIPATTTERTRPNMYTATALLSRVYLYTGDYADAITQASLIISDSGTYKLNSLSNVFLKDNVEAIWQLQPVVTGFNTQEANYLIIPTTGLSNSNPVYLNSSLLNAFELNDNRRSNWIDSIIIGGTTYYYAYKYKVLYDPTVTSTANMTEYPMIFRLGEQYLIRSEANAELGNTSGSISDLNVIRSRAGLPGYAGSQDKASLISAIVHERQVELFTEWGHRWLDLKRLNMVDSVMSTITPQKGGSWSADWTLYPISQTQLLLNTSLVQNPGY